MEPIYHLVEPDRWRENATSDYAPASLAMERFIHCSFKHQVVWAANRFYKLVPALSLVQLDPSRLKSPVKVEPPSPPKPGEEEPTKLFPHVYGPLQRQAVVAVHVLTRDDQGQWVFPG